MTGCLSRANYGRGFSKSRFNELSLGGREPLRQAMAFKELPHHLGGVDFLSRPGVAQTIDADHSDLGTVTATGVAHRRQEPGGIFQNDFGTAAIVTGPTREGVRNTLQ